MPWPWQRQDDNQTTRYPWQRWETGADLARDVWGGPPPQWFSRLADWSRSYLGAAGTRLREAWERPAATELQPLRTWRATPTPADYENTPEGRRAAYQQWRAQAVQPPGWATQLLQQGPGVIGQAGRAIETAGRTGAQAASWGLEAIQEPARAAKGAIGWAAVGMHPEAREIPIETLYPLIEQASSLGYREAWGAGQPALEQARRVAEERGPLAALTTPYTAGGPWAPGSATSEAIAAVKAAPPEEQAERAAEVAAEVYHPAAEVAAEVVLDPLNLLDVAGTSARAYETARAVKAAEREYTTAQRVAQLSTKLDEVLETGRAMDHATRPAEQTGRIRALFGDWDQFKQTVNPFALTPESRAAADRADTYLVTANLLEGAGDAQQARTRLEFFRTNPTEAAKVYGSYLASAKGRRVAETLRGTNLNALEWLAPGRPFQPQAAAMEIHERVGPVLETLHGVTEPTGYPKLARSFKRLASEFYMNLNPGFAFRNAINNAVTLAYDGLLTMDTPAEIDRYLQRLDILPARIRVTGAAGGLQELTGPESRLPGALGRVSEAGARLARTSWIGEEAFYKRGFAGALRRTLAQTWHSGRRVPAPPPEVYRALGPGGTAHLVAAAAAGVNTREIVDNVRRVLNPQRPGDVTAFVVRYLDPDQLDYLSPAVVAHLQDRILAADNPAQVSEAIQETRQAIIQQGDAAYRRELLDPNRRIFTEAATAEGLTELIQGMLEDAKILGIPDETATQWVARIEARIRMVEDQLRQGVSDLTRRAGEIGTRDAALVAYEANRQQAEMLAETRRVVDELRREAWDLVDAAPAEAGAIWERYFAQANQEWERHFSEALQVVEDARADLERLAAGVAVTDLVGADPRELAEQRLARQAALARKAGEELPELGADFDRRLEVLRSRVDLAQENAWRVGFQAPDQETLDILEDAYRYEQDVARKWRTERDALRNEMLGKFERLPRRGKSKEEIAEARAALRLEYGEKQDELARLRFGQQQKRWEIAEAEVRHKMAGGDVPPPTRPEITAPTRFVRRPPPEGATPVDAALWDMNELSRELEIMRADMASGARPHDPAALADMVDRIAEARDRAIVEGRRGLGELSAATHTQLRRRGNRRWSVDIYQNDRVIGTETFDTFREAQARRQELGLALTAVPDVARSPGAQIERMADLQRRVRTAEGQAEQVREWARAAAGQGATATRIAWDRELSEWALDFLAEEGETTRRIARHPMGRDKTAAQRAADLGQQVLETGAEAAAPPAAATAERLEEAGVLDRARQLEEIEAEHPLDAALARAFAEPETAGPGYPRGLEEAADTFLGKTPETAEDWQTLSERLQAASNEALSLASEEGLELEIQRRLYVTLDQPRYVEIGGYSREVTRQKRAGVSRESLRREILGGRKPAEFYQHQGDVAEWYNGLATDAGIRSVGGEAPPRTPPAWLEPPAVREEAPAYAARGIRPRQRRPATARALHGLSPQQMIAELEETGLMPARRAADLLGQQRPAHLAGVIDYLEWKKGQFLRGETSARDVAKAMVLNSSSQRASEIRYDTFRNTLADLGYDWMEVPEDYRLWIDGEWWIRPEDATAVWLLTPEGRQALDEVERGILNRESWAGMEKVHSAWGLPVFEYHNTFEPYPAGTRKWNLSNVLEFTDELNRAAREYAAGARSWEDLDKLAREVNGVSYAKSGFFKHFLGMGDAPTIDSVEISWWLTGEANAQGLSGRRADLAREVNARAGRKYVADWMTTALIERFDEIEQLVPGAQLDTTIRNHVIHHWLWDAAKGTETSHQGLYEAMRLAEQADLYEQAATVADDVNARLVKAAEAGEWPDAQGAQLSFSKYESGPGEQVALDGSKEPAHGWAKMYQTELVQRGYLDFRGKPISRVDPAHDIANLFRIYRDPEMETLRLIYIRDGQLAAHEAFTSGMVDTVMAGGKNWDRWLYQINQRADRLGADQIYLLHNHPSGSPRPSPEDIKITYMVKEKVPRLEGHVVIDGQDYAYITAQRTMAQAAQTAAETRPYWRPAGVLPYGKPEPLPWELEAGPASGEAARQGLKLVQLEQVRSPHDVANVARRIHEDGITVLWLNTRLQVVGFEQRPVEWLTRPGDFWELLDQQQRFMDAAHGALVVDERHEAALRSAVREYQRSLQYNLVPAQAAPWRRPGVDLVDILLWNEENKIQYYRSMKETEGIDIFRPNQWRYPFRRVFERAPLSQWALDEQIKAVESARRRVDVIRERTKLEVGAAPDAAYRTALEQRRRSEEGLQVLMEQAQEAGLDVSRAQEVLAGPARSPVVQARAQQGAAEFPTLAELTKHVEPRALEALDAIEAGVLSDWGQWQGRQADARTAAAADAWLQGQVLPAFENARLGAVVGAQRLTDRAMLNYSAKNRIDEILSLAFPYHFWYTRSAKNWAQRLARDPARLNLYLRYRRLMQEQNRERGLRQRFETRWRVPVPAGMQAAQGGPWPEYLDPALYVDPTTWIFPFSTFDRVDWDNPEESQNALTALYQGMTNFGFRPYAFLELPIQYAGQLGESREEIGDLVPQTGIVRAATTLAREAGAQLPAGGVGIETPIRRAAGLGEQGPWDPYRVQRMLASMAADDPDAWQVALDAQELQQQVTQGALDLRVATGEAAPDVGLQGIAQRYGWSPERLQAAQAMLQEAVQRAAVERAIPAVASFAGIPAAVVATGEQRQLELQREGQAQTWAPERPAGSRAGYEAWRDVHPEQYARSMGYQVLPGETPSEWWTPGTAGNVVAARQERDRIIADYNARIDEALTQDITDQWQARQLQEQMQAELDAVDQRYPVAESTTQTPAARYGQTPAEYGRAVLDRELRRINETLPRYADFANYEEYEAALDVALGALPESNTALQMAQRSGATRALSVREALEAWRRRYDTPLEALQKTYFDTVYWPAMDEYQRRVDAGQEKGEAWDDTIGAIGPMRAEELIPEVVGSYPDQGWQTEHLRSLYQGIEFPSAEEAGEGRRAPEERQFWQMLELIPYTADVRDMPAVALVLSHEMRATATPEQMRAANDALQGWLAEHPEAEQAALQAEELAAEIERRWPGIRALEKDYFQLTKAERVQFREEHPELAEMWDFKDAWKPSHPEYVAIYDPDFEPDKAKGDGRRKAESEREGYTKVYQPGAPWWASYRSGGGGRSSPKRYKPTWKRQPTWGRREVIRAGL